MKKSVLIFVFVLVAAVINAQKPLFKFGDEIDSESISAGKKQKAEKIQWIQVNTEDSTWQLNGKELICFGNPIGVIRSEKEYENFVLHIEWRHMKAGGNSGTFVWSKAQPGTNRLPDGVEVQMLELDWVNQNIRNGEKPPIAYVHGELFGVGGVKIIPDNPRGERSKSVENRCLGKGEWNTYEVVCVDGTIKLAVNGKFVNGISQASQRKGFICLEAEGSEIQFRNIRLIKLP